MRIDATAHFPIRARKLVWIVVFAATGLAHIPANEPNNPAQQRVALVYQNLQTATVRIRSGTDVASGVIVSKTGMVLTVAHGLKPDTETVTVLLPDGKSCEAKCVTIDRQADVALLEMQMDSLPDVNWSIVPVPDVIDAVVGEGVVASGFPAREPDGMTPVVRLGEVLAVQQSSIRSSCTLTSGDSGGPLVNSRGELIGLHRQIGVETNSNTHVALSAIRSVLEKSEQWKSIRVQAGSGALLLSKDLMPSQHVMQTARRATVEIFGVAANGESGISTLGTLLDDQHVATKLSDILAWSDLSCRAANGMMITAKITKSDRTWDLAILKLTDAIEAGDSIAESYATVPDSKTLIGQIVFAATGMDNVSTAGIVCRTEHTEPTQAVRFGAALQTAGQDVQITELSPNGSAVSAGMQIGDKLLSMDASTLSSLQDVSNLLAIRQPGDWVLVEGDRMTRSFIVQMQLQRDPAQQFEKTEFLDGRAGQLSQRRSGFTSVLQHDIVIDPAACGGPLLDSDGHVVAINIARRSRDATFAIPIHDVIEFAR